MKNFKYTLWTVVAVIILGSVFGMIKLASKQNGSPADSFSLADSFVLDNDNFKGDKNIANAPVLVEYSDFQCPACASYHPMIKKITEEFSGKIIFVYRHFPLAQHGNARTAAVATEASGKQGKFWEMHDTLFENQEIWAEAKNAEEIFTGYAKNLGLDENKFKNDLLLKEIKDKINADYSGGIKSKVNSTPSFFLNGKKISNPRDYFELKTIIENAISQTNEQSGTKNI